MSAIQLFQFREQAVRCGGTSDKPWFVASDVADILDISNLPVALDGQARRRADGTTYHEPGLDDDEKGIHIVNTLGGNQELRIVYESGLYALAFKCRKPEARAFRKWVTSEVLPAIRKTGSYSVPSLPPPPSLETSLLAVQTGERILSADYGDHLEPRDRLILQDFVRNRLTLEVSGTATATQFVTIPERCVALGYPKPRRGEDCQVGKAVARVYRQKHDGDDPPKQTQFVDGRAVMVNTYTSADLDVVDKGIHAYHRAISIVTDLDSDL